MIIISRSLLEIQFSVCEDYVRDTLSVNELKENTVSKLIILKTYASNASPETIC